MVAQITIGWIMKSIKWMLSMPSPTRTKPWLLADAAKLWIILQVWNCTNSLKLTPSIVDHRLIGCSTYSSIYPILEGSSSVWSSKSLAPDQIINTLYQSNEVAEGGFGLEVTDGDSPMRLLNHRQHQDQVIILVWSSNKPVAIQTLTLLWGRRLIQMTPLVRQRLRYLDENDNWVTLKSKTMSEMNPFLSWKSHY